MAWTTEVLVRSIIKTDPELTSLQAFIDASHELILTHCEGLTETEGQGVETWLTAHLITIRDNRVASENVADAGVTYQHKIDIGLNSSMYGQTAMLMDRTGGLTKWNKQILNGKTQVQIRCLGRKV